MSPGNSLYPEPEEAKLVEDDIGPGHRPNALCAKDQDNAGNPRPEFRTSHQRLPSCNTPLRERRMAF